MEKDDKGSTMIRMGVSGWMFLLVPAYPGCPGSKAVKRSLLLLLLFICVRFSFSLWTLDYLCNTTPLLLISGSRKMLGNSASWLNNPLFTYTPYMWGLAFQMVNITCLGSRDGMTSSSHTRPRDSAQILLTHSAARV